MNSLIPGYNYDIFVSYRQKDNKYDGWVSEFVDNLKKELEARFKEEISVYFDINPHDGLLETHDVDASLKDKLRCLVFIPIISRTYCDPNSFAWEHEFKAFIEQSSKDQFGLKVRLPNGNVAARLLPIQINDIHPEDKSLLERELGGVLRAIEFIFKEPGVNRPLSPKDSEEKNSNKTNYRNQINKVANSIDEVIHSLTSFESKPEGRKIKNDQPSSRVNEETVTSKLSETVAINKRSKKWLIILLSLVLCIIVAFAINKIIVVSKKDKEIAGMEKSIAVLPFNNLSNDPQQEYFNEGMRQEILNHLFKIGGLKIPSSSSTMRFTVSELSVREIARKLGVSFVLEGNVSKSDSNVRIIVTLINGKNEHVVWTEDYKRSMTATDVLEIQSDIALMVAENLKVVINPEVKKRIKTRPTENTEAYSLYLEVIGGHVSWDQQAMQMLKRAISLDPDFADAYALLAYWRMWYTGDSLSREQLLEKVEPPLNKALELDKNSIMAHNVLGEFKMWYYWDLKSVEKEYKIVKQLNPSNTGLVFGFIQYLWAVGRNNEAYTICKANFEQGKILDEISLDHWTMMALAYFYMGDQAKAVEAIESALRLFPHEDFLIHNAMEIFRNSAKYKELIALFEKDFAGKDYRDLPAYFIGPLGIAYFKTGEKSKTDVILNELLSRNRNYAMNYSASCAASIYVSMGEYNKAFQMLEKAYTRHEPGLIMIKVDPALQPLHGDPRFESLLLKMGFK